MSLIKSILLAITLLCFHQFSLAQCAGCVVNNAFTSTDYGLSQGTVANPLPNATQGQPYDQDITVYVERDIDYNGIAVTLDKIKIVSVTGLPFGMAWQSNAANNDLLTPNAQNRYCVKLCGTPIQAGTYNINVNTVAYVISPTTLTQNVAFPIQLIVLPGSGGNQLFSISTNNGCAPMQTTLASNMLSNGYQPTATTTGFTYNWNFGIGQTSTLANPLPRTYNSSGTFPIQYNVTIDTIGFELTEIKLVQINCTDGPTNHSLDQAPWFYVESKPDVFLLLTDGNGNTAYTTENEPVTIAYSPWGQGVINPLPYSFTIPPLKLTTPPYRLKVMDQDAGLFGSDDNCIDDNGGSSAFLTLNLPPNTPAGFGTNTYNASQGGLQVQYTIRKEVVTLQTTDTIKVFPKPTTPTVLTEPDPASFCEGDSARLYILSTADAYQWYKDSNALIDGLEQDYTVRDSGNYYLTVTNQYGCTATSAEVPVTVHPKPLQPFFLPEPNQILAIIEVPGSQYQWYLNNQMIPGATNLTYNYNTNGTYSVRAMNEFGCINFSNPLLIDFISISELEKEVNFNLYPNPTSHSLNANLEFQTPQNVSIEIYNSLGQQILIKEFPSTSSFKETISVEDYSNGFYSIIFNFDNKQIRKKFIKN